MTAGGAPDVADAKGRDPIAVAASSDEPAPTLADSLAADLDVVFVGINPSVYSAERGHYFARPTNRFWPSLSRSVLSARARQAFGVAALRFTHDRALLAFGIGFTDLVKRSTPRAGDLTAAELAGGVAAVAEKLARYRPLIACFHGITGYRYVHRALTGTDTKPQLGLSEIRIGSTHVFVVPNPSGANAHYTPTEQTQWYDRLAECVDGLRRNPPPSTTVRDAR